MPGPVDEVREALRALVVDAHDRVVTSPEQLTAHKGGVAAYDTERDKSLLELPAFGAALESLRSLPEFVRAFGDELSERATLQFLYSYFTRTNKADFDASAFDASLEALINELRDPNLTFVSFANLRTFKSADPLIDFGEGISIRHRSLEDIRDRLGWTDWHIDHLTQDWFRGHGASSHVIWAETVVQKSPDVALYSGSAEGPSKVINLLDALWLHAPGDVSIGAIYSEQAANFRLSGGGLSYTSAMPTDTWGRDYSLSADQAPEVRAIYDEIVAFRQKTDVPNNVRLAMRRFESVYTRGLMQREDRIIDELIALEALAGSGTELRFRLAFRISSILAAEDHERLRMFEAMKRYYDVRSKIVHGANLRTAEKALVDDDDELRGIVRRLVRAVVSATVHTDFRLTASYIDEQLDKVLLDPATRAELRKTLGLTA